MILVTVPAVTATGTQPEMGYCFRGDGRRRWVTIAGAVLLTCAGWAGGCRDALPDALWSVVWPERHSIPVMIYGIEGSPELASARQRLEAMGICYEVRSDCSVAGLGPLMTEGCEDALLDYMRCEVFVFGGATHPNELSSFVWIGGQFRGDAFVLDSAASGGMDDNTLLQLSTTAGAELQLVAFGAPTSECAGGGSEPQPITALECDPSIVNAACCKDSSSCNPWPSQCTVDCRAAWSPFWAQCHASLSVDLSDSDLRGITSFAQQCIALEGTATSLNDEKGWGDDDPLDGTGATSATTPMDEFTALCGPQHEPCSLIPAAALGSNGVPIGLWDVGRIR